MFRGDREDPSLTKGALGAGDPQPCTHTSHGPPVLVSLQHPGLLQKVQRHGRDQPQGSAADPPGMNGHFPSLPELAGQLDEALDVSGVFGHVMEISMCFMAVGTIPSWGCISNPTGVPLRIGSFFPLLANLP